LIDLFIFVAFLDSEIKLAKTFEVTAK